MIEYGKAKKGVKVKCQLDGKIKTVLAVSTLINDSHPVKSDDGMWYSVWALDPIDPPAPQRVEVVTETREVIKEVVIRLPVNVAKYLASITGPDKWNECRDELKAALAAQEAKS